MNLRQLQKGFPVLVSAIGILLLLGVGLAIQQEQAQRKAWSTLQESLLKRNQLVPNLIYLAKTNPGYPDLEGAATLFRAQKTCELFDTANTVNYLSICAVEMEKMIRSQQATLASRLEKSAKKLHWKQLSLELDKATDRARFDCRALDTLFERRPALSRPFAWLMARHDWAASRVCR